MRSKIIFFSLILFCAALVFPLEKTQTLNLDAKGIDKLKIDCGAGSLTVNGMSSSDQIEVTAEILVKGISDKKAEDFIKKYLKLYLEKRGRQAVLVSQFKSFTSFISLKTAVINLEVNVPENIELNVDDGSGTMKIENIGRSVNIDDGSGEIVVINIEGNLDIEDGSGTIDITGVSGDVSLDDGSGSIYVKKVGGSVTISDGSGSITVDGVDKDVRIKDDGSGSVNIENVKGKVSK
jgi:hypothetical protein